MGRPAAVVPRGAVPPNAAAGPTCGESARARENRGRSPGPAVSAGMTPGFRHSGRRGHPGRLNPDSTAPA